MNYKFLLQSYLKFTIKFYLDLSFMISSIYSIWWYKSTLLVSLYIASFSSVLIKAGEIVVIEGERSKR